ncbi:arsenic resistance protein|uniref:Arsenite efflux pump ArsB, ACR3 family n=1 Tax=Dendrosporobacter quercicolus TaxID=146817 RepID=A0A1G9NLA9_9FIRM|nr:bile acid:sodium symporter [Dendrosporobacter quercicolus]NSL47374.1 arsenic resistance protein [Dendrosporobacter quercicolus DSM 1736]SDL87144.1 Arsenite efflux pump ArsB, ACR3 family [Dendrosporobacter quercicolus]
MSKLEKYQSFIIFLAIPIGILLGQIQIIEQYAENFVTPFLFVMLFGAFLNIPLNDYRKAFANIKFSITTVLINFVWTPILVWLLGKLFLSSSAILQIGFIMLMVTPCTDWYLIFTGAVKGNVPLSASVLPVNLILQVILLPLYLLIFGSASGTANMQEVLISITVMLLLPFTLAQLGKFLLSKMQNNDSRDKIFAKFSASQTILLAMAITAMFAAKGSSLLSNLNVVAVLLIPIVLFYMINFVLAQLVGNGFGYSYEDTASLTLTIVAKNSPMTLGVALMAFPNEPLIHLIMIIEPLIELPALMLITKALLVIRNKQAGKQEI